jgi:uncharacterized zinc-type alcohol dehydrogenase-like protein
VPFTVDRREPGPHDVLIDVEFCGICHSDIHQARDEWSPGLFPMVPGHEIVGRVSRLGAEVTRFAVGDRVGVGCMVDSCRTCAPCRGLEEQFCEQGCAWTYNGTEMDRVTRTYGGYSQQVVVADRFVLAVPGELDPAAAAPLLCAGITTYSPLRQWGCGPGRRVAVAGLGGLGHMGVKLAAAMGAEVTVLSTSEGKREASRRLGAHAFERTGGPEAFTKLANRFDIVLDTISAPHDYNLYLGLLAPFGTLALVGAPPAPGTVDAFALIHHNRRFAGSSIGGTRETQEMLEFCAGRKLVSDVEVIPVERVNEAYDRVVRGDVRYRFVIDNATIEP